MFEAFTLDSKTIIIAVIIIMVLVVAGVVIACVSFDKHDKKMKEIEVKAANTVVKEVKSVAPVAGSEDTTASLTEAMAQAKAGHGSIANKVDIVEFVKNNCKGVEIKHRGNYTKPGRGKTEGLPLADTYYIVKGETRACFAYVYELNGQNVFMILKLEEKAMKELKESCPTLTHSAFPKSNDIQWYSLVIDDHFTNKEQVYNAIKFAHDHYVR